MPVFIDIMANKVLGREIRKGELIILRRLIEKRLGAMPGWSEERLASVSARVLDAENIEDLLKADH